ncbi:hypothetical protein B0H14DRAFT_3517181 [Mycena olivaceomarginata]|nr:hypothetical protein B0H14DRAFT_3517181 [Mycena olivaceomarginata]
MSFTRRSTRLTLMRRVEDNEEDKEDREDREDNGEKERAGNGEVPLSPNELADHRANAETVSQRILDAVCDQMQCKGLLLLGQIISSEGDEEHQVFYLLFLTARAEQTALTNDPAPSMEYLVEQTSPFGLRRSRKEEGSSVSNGLWVG